jgi:PAS domain S-box-containing protein
MSAPVYESVFSDEKMPGTGSPAVLDLLKELPAFVYEVRGYWDGRPQLTFMSSKTYITGHDVSHWAADYSHITEFVHPQDLPAHAELRRRAYGGEEIVRAEYRERTVRGDYIWVLDVCKRTYDRSGMMILSGFCLDITSRKLQEAGLLERERRLRAVMESGSSQVMELDASGRLVHVSANSISGFPATAFSDDPVAWFNVIAEPDRDRVRHVVMDAIQRRTGCDVQFRIARMDGTAGSIRLVLTYFAGELGSPGWVGVLSDVSELSALTLRARYAEESARAAVHRAGALVYRWRHYGASLGLGAYERAPRMEIHPDDLNDFNATHRELSLSHGWREVDFRWRRRDEPWRWVRSTACSLGDGAAVFGVFRPDDDTLTREREREQVTAKLSMREQQVLQLLLSGSTNRMIARSLHLSEKTASHHVASLLDKLNLPNRASAAALAARLYGGTPTPA